MGAVNRVGSDTRLLDVGGREVGAAHLPRIFEAASLLDGTGGICGFTESPLGVSASSWYVGWV
jgi:hypothetical protein